MHFQCRETRNEVFLNILGIRVEPKQTTFVIIHRKNDDLILINCECIKVPAALDFPEKLKYLRNCVLDILREYKVSVAGIRIAESITQNLNVTRLHIEGVIQEAFSSSNVDKYFTGRKNSIAARLNLKSSELDEYVSGRKKLSSLENWDALTTQTAREAALVALGALEL